VHPKASITNESPLILSDGTTPLPPPQRKGFFHQKQMVKRRIQTRQPVTAAEVFENALALHNTIFWFILTH